ncbi:hypothetical protein CROQUDRAFT_46662 [Cronartium quercuum f. sp. fusiforme G11]|uniref:Rab-GAP TBC domain-containing protein n=1 Tax=Cronartium quercuum f. sp. fusiforme G11 TaxID=708437 RepID=A0A9P6NJU0_9BASI|nr:hypothetical protein CROQUDRAFT_46662 [Cronartium quercuum f. sp. fusiforme G11]
MGGGPNTPPDISLINHSELSSPNEAQDQFIETRSVQSEDLIEVTHSESNQSTSALEDSPDLIQTDDLLQHQQTSSIDEQCPYKLRWSKSKVYVHPTAFLRDNVPGYLGILQRARASFYLSWIPEHLLSTSTELEQWVNLENEPDNNNGDILVTIPPESTHSATNRTHAFSVPIDTIYSIILRPPTLSSWYGTVLINLYEGITLPILYFHDDESSSTQFARQSIPVAIASKPPRTNLPSSWGGDALLSQLRKFADVLPSKLETGLYLINPSTDDRECHLTPIFDDDSIFDTSPLPNRLKPHRNNYDVNEFDGEGGFRNSILHQSLGHSGHIGPLTSGSGSMDHMTFNLLSSFSRITQNARSAAQLVLSHRLAKPIIPHLPKPIASLANGEPEFIRWSQNAGVEGYDVARVYLAKWASIVAAQGEQSRRLETGEWDFEPIEDVSIGGGFEMIHKLYQIPRSKSNRVPTQPIQIEEFISWQDDQGKLLLNQLECKKRIFQRGLALSARQSVWPYLLGIYDWESDKKERELKLKLLREEYKRLKDGWENDDSGLKETLSFKEEAHRIDIDCRRTDRTQSYFAIPSDPSTIPKTEEEIESDEASNMPTTNKHVERYVQGMSDLCAPLYVVFEANQTLTFYCFVKLMDRMGMKNELSNLQRLLALIDPTLYRHFERTNSLNLFICFRWILIGFKREFAFKDVMKVWEAMWTDVCGSHTDLFIALAILEKHREPMIRYLREFDETLDCDEILAQAEVLYLTFKSILEKYPTGDINDEEGKKKRVGVVIDDELRALLL